jgi:stearoyl-CoA desaturase (delta-9 desaturase)
MNAEVEAQRTFLGKSPVYWNGLATIWVVAVMHVACLATLWVGVSWVALLVCLLSYQIRGFGITGAYHRYFSHRSYKTSRWFQFVLALLGTSALQGTPIEWSKNHRHHHNHSDKDRDIHSPARDGFWWSHMGWMLTTKGHPVSQRCRDLEKFPELRATSWIQIFTIGGVMLGMYLLGEALGPAWGTSGMQMFVWGFVVATVILWHVTYCINSLCHIWGKARYDAHDDSKNSFLLAMLALGEGWHNNHHKYPSAARNGFFWWEVDLTYYILKVLNALGLIWDLIPPPEAAYDEANMLSGEAAATSS